MESNLARFLTEKSSPRWTRVKNWLVRRQLLDDQYENLINENLKASDEIAETV